MKAIVKKNLKYVLSFILALTFVIASAQSDYSVLGYWQYYSDAENSLYKQQCEIAFRQLAERKKVVSRLQSIGEWKQRQQEVRETFMNIVGPFPEKSPLNPVITGKVKGDGFTVEKLYFESMPGVKVTAGFFIPEGKARKLPTVIFCSGHSDLAFRSDVYQRMILNLVKKGFAVLAFDPFGQGERLQYLVEDKTKSRFSPTREHSYPGAQFFINGASAARYMIWDGIRSVDYLLTRKEVDPERIGITGRSGGGTQSSYIAAFDDRIKAAAPECYITSMEYLWKSMGPQDAEQNFFNGIVKGIDLADLLEVRAPKPALMITTTRDIFSIQGARDTYMEVQQAYSAFGATENVEMVEDNDQHASTKKNREAMYAFFQKHLDNPGSSADLEVELFAPEALHVTKTGQLETSVGSNYMFDINKSIADSNIKALQSGRAELENHLNNIKKDLSSVSGFEPVTDFGKLVFSGRTVYDNHVLEKYIVEVGPNNVLPFIVLIPKNQQDKVVFYLDDIEDKKSEKEYEIPLGLVNEGMTVIMPDLPGYGELGPGYFKGDAYFNGTSYNQWFAGILTGKSTVAIHVESLERVLYHCHEILDMKGKTVSAISSGPFNSVLLHASALGTDFDEMILIDPVLSFASIVSNKEYEPSFVPFSVAGGLKYYDLPDLAAAFAPKKLIIYNAVDQLGQMVTKVKVEESMNFVNQRYSKLNSIQNFTIVVDKSEELSETQLSNFLDD